MAELRERLAAGDPSAMEELRALVSRSDGESSGTVTSRGTMNWETMRAKLAELQARAAAGDPTVKIETQTRMTQRGPETTTTVSYPTAGASQKITRRSTSPSRATEMTAEEKARRQAYVASHPDLPARTKESILAGLFVLAMKFEDVEQLMGPLKPVEGPLPDGVALDPDVKVYTAQESGRTVYVLFRDGKLVRR